MPEEEKKGMPEKEEAQELHKIEFGFSPAVVLRMDMVASEEMIELGRFILTNSTNENMGIVITLDDDDYAPGSGSDARKYSVLDRSLLGYYLNQGCLKCFL